MSKKKATFAQIINYNMAERKPQRESRKASDKGRKPWTIHTDDDTPKRKESSRSSTSAKKNDRPRFRDNDEDKPKRSTRSSDSTRSRKSSDKEDRPKRSYGDKDKPKRSYRDEDKPKRSARSSDSTRSRKPSDKEDRPKRSYGDKDKSRRSYRDEDKPKRSYRDEDKPKRSTRSSDSYGERSYGKKDSARSYKSSDREDRPKRSYADKDKPRRSYRDEDKPKRSYRDDDRSSKRTTKRDDSGNRSSYKDREEGGFDSYKGKKKDSYSYISSYEPEDSRDRKNRLKNAPAKPKNEPKLTAETRLNKYIANSGVCSRREADTYIKAGVVSINGTIVTELGTKVMPGDEVRFNGELLRGEQKAYLLMNKPKGYVTTVEDPHADKTVMEIVGSYTTSRVYPVGRLDKNSTGVLLFTNDGELTLQLTHPSYNKKKIYQVKLDKPLTKNDMQQLIDGVGLEDGLAYFDVLEYQNEERTEFGVEIHSGRNRIIRRMFEYLGYKVTKLDRVYFAGLTKKNLKRGECRFLTDKEVSILKMGAYE